MTLKRRLDRIERQKGQVWRTAEEIPTTELDALVRKAYQRGRHSEEEAKICRELEALGFRFSL